MENQHRLVRGSHEWGQMSVDAMNAIKEAEEQFLRLIAENELKWGASHRWTAIAKTAMEKACMYACRAVDRDGPEVKTDV